MCRAQRVALANAPKGSTTVEVKRAAFMALREKLPELNLTRQIKGSSSKTMRDTRCFAPPHCPDIQPIELFRGDAKNLVARTFEGTRSMT